MKKNTSRLIPAALAAILTLTLCAPSLAVTTANLLGTVEITVATSLRSEPSASSATLMTLQKGNTALLLDTYGTWSLIDYAGSMGYVLTSRTKVVPGSGVGITTAPAGTGTAQATGAVNIRSGPGAGYPKLGKLKKGALVTTLGAVNGWTIISFANGTAYVSSGYLKTVTTAPGTGSGTVIYVRFEKDGAVYTGPSTSNKKLDTFSAGDELEYVDTYGSYYKVKVGKQECYVLGSITSFVNGIPEKTEGQTVFASKLTRVYTGTAPTSGLITYMNAGDSARLISSSSSMVSVYYNGRVGYVDGGSVEKVTGTGTYAMREVSRWYYTTSKGAKVYSVPTEKSSYVTGTLAFNEAVWVINANDHWAKIIINNRPMFVPLFALSQAPLTGGPVGGSFLGALPGDRLTVKARNGAATYEDLIDRPYIPTGESAAYGTIARNSKVVLMRAAGEYCMVIWVDERDNPINAHRVHVAYVLKTDLR